MKKTHLTRWIRALRSGKFAQARGALVKQYGCEKSLCCIGVGYEVVRKEEITDDLPLSLGSSEAAEKIGLTYTQAGILMQMNDSDHKSFPEIADWLEANRAALTTRAQCP